MSVGRWGLALGSVGVVTGAAWVVGAAAARALPLSSPTVELATVGAGLVLGLVVVPSVAAFRLLARFPRAPRPVVSLAMLGGWSAAVAGGLTAGAPGFVADALRSDGGWFLADREVAAVHTVADGFAGLLAPPPPAPPPAPPPEEAAPGESAAEVAPEAPWTPARVFAARSPSVVVVYTRSKPEGLIAELLGAMGVGLVDGQGSGFAVGPDLVVTNHHVIGGAVEAAVRTPDGRELPVEVLVDDVRNDLALLRVPDLGSRALPLAQTVPAVGETVYAIGAPRGLDATFTEGIVSAHRDAQGTRELQMQAPIAPGSSGGPLLDARGEVVGVNTATKGSGLHLAVEVGHVRDVLSAARGATPIPPLTPRPVLARSTVTPEVDPSTREQLVELGGALIERLAPCLAAVPDGARIEVRADRSTRVEVPAFDAEGAADAVLGARHEW